MVVEFNGDREKRKGAESLFTQMIHKSTYRVEEKLNSVIVDLESKRFEEAYVNID